ncbi:MAG: cysteine--tRNA ligase [Dehalococcoidia bacterium]|nr:MAG: cysteine--tRNA ligase [Dehalococcoidia bacterium]
MKISNTLTSHKEEFTPEGDPVKMYVCGITPQSSAHIGHAMSYINFDVIRRYLLFRGHQVKYVQNFTDVDDKIIAKSAPLGITPLQLADRNIADFQADMADLNIMPADAYPRVTQEIPDIIDLVAGLVQKGFAYEIKGSVYFRVTKLNDYGKLSHRTLDQMQAGARIEVDQDKEYPMDFVVWKAAKPGEPSWDSPWGQGRPGWHIECSAMSLKYLGETIDIHGGGADLIFPHHENEIAQSESFTSKKPFVRYWLHNGLLQLGGEKMSKSLGNLITIKEALSKYSADTMRVFVLNSHYRSPLTYSDEIIEAAEKGTQRLIQAVQDIGSGGKTVDVDSDAYRKRFIQAMDDDFNTPRALATLFDLAREINRMDADGSDSVEPKELLKELAAVLGLKLEVVVEVIDAEKLKAINGLLALRAEYRRHKDFVGADLTRKKLETMGVNLKDGTSAWVTSVFTTVAKNQPMIDSATPSNLTPEARISKVPVKPFFHWAAVTDAISYELWIDTNSDFSTSMKFTSTTPTFELTGKELVYETDYYRKVRAITTIWEYNSR